MDFSTNWGIMIKNMILIIGLGNPGEKYKNTRHNIGFIAIDEFAKNNNFPEFKLDKKSNSEISEEIFGEQKIILTKPQTFMNESGKAVRSLTTRYKLQTTNLVVIHDDIDLPVGKIKIVKDRGSAGHKGVESIIKAVGNDGLIRIRIGIGSANKIEAMEVVLKKFSTGEKNLLNQSLKKTASALDLFIKEGLDRAMNEYNK